MSLSTPFVNRPVGTTLLTMAIGLAGVIGYFALPVSPLPQVEFPTIQVQSNLPGASPETMASAVATPLERQFGRIAGVTEMTSTSTLGQTTIVLQFDLARSIDAAARDVQAAINAARGQLPSNLPQNPSYRKVNPADPPILVLALTSEIYDNGRLYDVAATILQQKLSQVKGVGQVTLGGAGALPGVRVDLNPTLLTSAGLTLEDVRSALARANTNRPKGQLADRGRAIALRTTDQLLSAKEWKPLVVAFRRGAAVRLSDIATVTDSVEDIRTGGASDGKPAILLIVFRQPGANIIEAVDRVRAALPTLRAEIPAAVDLEVVLDRTETIRTSVRDVEITLAISIALVIVVVFLFLRDLRTTLVPSVAVPISLVGTFGVMYLGGYSIDNLSLMALTIATGFVVDDAIVVIENITRHLELGETPMRATLIGAREIGFTVVSISVSLIAVFTPILLMGGIVGRLFREFAVTISVAIAVSLVVSLTTTPMMCARLVRARGDQEGRLFHVTERAFRWVLSGYEATLALVLRHPAVTFLSWLATIALTIYLFHVIPTDLFPQQDTGRLVGQVIADQDTSFQAVKAELLDFARIVGEDPAVRRVIAFTGGTMGGAANTGRMFAVLAPLSERGLSADEVMARLRPKVSQRAGASLFLQPVQDLRIGGAPSAAQYQFTLGGETLEELSLWAPRVLAKMRGLPGLADVNTNQQDRGLTAALAIDRAMASRLGVTTKAIDDTLYDAFGQRQVSTMYTQLNQYHVVMEIEPRFWQNPDGLRTTYVRGVGGAQVPLCALARYGPSRSALAVNHAGLFPSVTISFNLRPGVSLGNAVDEITRATRDMGLPSTIHARFAGAAQAFQEALRSYLWLGFGALFVVYIVLGILYESLIHPVTILSTLPSAGMGALLALLLTHTALSVIALIGILLLIGIVKKNAIMMIDFALEAERGRGKPPREAIFEACILRFRPITMTTMAAILGAAPLALGVGTGAELRQPLGIAIVGGLVVSQLMTLYTTPVVYLYFDRLRIFLRDLTGRPREGPHA